MVGVNGAVVFSLRTSLIKTAVSHSSDRTYLLHMQGNGCRCQRERIPES
jgi:hypothetical protein